MTEKTFRTRLQNARDTLSNWQMSNPIIKAGELIVVFDIDDDPAHYGLKLGDGVTPFSDLPYFEDPTKLSKAELGVAGGVASLDENGKIPLIQLPDNIGGKPLYTVIERVPKQLGTLIYNGEIQMPVWSDYDPDIFLISGTVSAKDAGEYTTIFQPAVGYVWPDGTQSPKYCKWKMEKKVIPEIPSLATDTFTFNGTLQTPSWLNYDAEELTIGGVTNGTAVGEYTTTFTPKSNYKWADGTSDTKEVTWSIEPQSVAIPEQNGKLIYNGNVQSRTWSNYESDAMTISGAINAMDADTYTVTFTLKAGYVWTDGTNESVEVDWTIGRANITAIPSQSGSLTYSGSTQSPSWNSYNTAQLTIGGTTSSTNAGTFIATFTPTSNYCWEDGTNSAKNVNWLIGRQELSTIPSQSGTLTYSGSAQSPLWSNYDSNKLTLGGTTSGTNAGSYNATFTPKSNYCWSGGATTAKTVAWAIGKATGTMSISPTSLSYTALGSTNAKKITVTSTNTGTATASSNKTSIATTSVSGKTVTVTPVADGSATITIGMPADTNYFAPTSKTCSVAIDSLYSGLSKNATAAQFQQVIKAGQGPNRFAVGDLTKPITINTFNYLNWGQMDFIEDGFTGEDTTFPTTKLRAQILGFNHNQPTEGTGNYADLQFGIDDAHAEPTGLTTEINMEPRSMPPQANYGYPDFYIATTFLPLAYNHIESAWRNIIINTSKYVVTKIAAETSKSTVGTFSSKLWLLSVFELVGLDTPTARGTTLKSLSLPEASYKALYQLYANGNSAVRCAPSIFTDEWRPLYLYTSTADRGTVGSPWSLGVVVLNAFPKNNDPDDLTYNNWAFNIMDNVVPSISIPAITAPAFRVG